MLITAIEEQKDNKGKMSVFVDNQYFFSIDPENLFQLDLFVGKEITEQEIEHIHQVCNFFEAKKQTIKYVVGRLRTAYEVENMLSKKGFDREVIKMVVDKLIELDYINDELYAQKYIKDAYHIKKFGKRRIYQELQQKGVEDWIIQQVLNSIEFNEKEALREMLHKKLDQFSQHDTKTLNKIRNAFLRKGYTPESIDECIDEYMQEK